MKSILFVLLSFSSAVLLTGILFLIPVLTSGSREISPLESIHGIPFVVTGNYTDVTEALAHADIFLHEPVFAKQLKLTVSFTPIQLQKLSVGIRENGFWLSYNPVTLYDIHDQNPDTTSITKTIIIPLTDKFQETDQSLDLLFFADNSKETSRLDQKTTDHTHWQLQALSASVTPVIPQWSETKDYLKSVFNRERAL